MASLHRIMFAVACLSALGALCPRTGLAEETAIEAAVANDGRLAADLERDENRKPVEILSFFGVAPGMRVFDLFSGGGYYSEILSHLVGPSGHVVAHNNDAYLEYAAARLKARFTGGRLGNVERLTAEANDLHLDGDSFDVVMMTLTYHDFYYVPEEDKNQWPSIDVPKLLAEVYKSLKPGGMLAVIDHAAKRDSPRAAGTTLHRIDSGIVMDEITAAGFVFDGESTLLRNPNDDLTRLVFDKSIRGKTDRFVYRFRKPPAS